MVNLSNAQQIQNLVGSSTTCIINIVAAWCSDCTEQTDNFADFASEFSALGIAVYQLNVQNDKHRYISPLHQQLTEQFGGHGFPRTILIKNGQLLDSDNVEVISSLQLASLAKQFKAKLDD